MIQGHRTVKQTRVQETQTKQHTFHKMCTLNGLHATVQSINIRSCTKYHFPHNLRLTSQSLSPPVTLVTPT